MEDACLEKKEPAKPATTGVHYILLVEDDAALRSFIAHLLKQAGHAVEVAANVDQGLSQLVAGTPSLVITDKNLPDGSGLKLINVNHHIGDIFRFSGFDQIFEITRMGE